jgi:hypothetical protein
VEDAHLQAHRTCCRFHVSHRGLGDRRIVRFDQQGEARGCRHHVAQQLEPLGCHLRREPVDAGQIAGRPRETCDQAKPDRIIGDDENDRDRRGRILGRERGGTGRCDDHSDPSARQVGGQRRQSIELILGPAVFDRDVLAFDIACFLEALAKPPHEVRDSISRSGIEKPNHRHRRLLRARRQRPKQRRRRGGAEERDEIPPFHLAQYHRLPRRGERYR